MADRGRLFLLIALFYLGWAKFLAPGTTIYLIDYGQRVLIIGLGWAALVAGCRPLLKPVAPALLITAFLGPALIIWLDGMTDPLAWRQALDTALFDDDSFPPIDNPTWEMFDIAVGLLLVAISEELVFRKMWTDWAKKTGQSEAVLYLWSSLVFGLIHLPQGLADTAVACFWGLLLIRLYRRGGDNLPLVIAVHYLVDIWYFT